jgi:hypothetical protein
MRASWQGENESFNGVVEFACELAVVLCEGHRFWWVSSEDKAGPTCSWSNATRQVLGLIE